jgi:hypothetical protein
VLFEACHSLSVFSRCPLSVSAATCRICALRSSVEASAVMLTPERRTGTAVGRKARAATRWARTIERGAAKNLPAARDQKIDR